MYLKHPKYRPDIDGLRAFAVLSVVGFHVFPDWIRAGVIGVDIFFVISGYLISSIIFENLRRETFSFTEFYIRRINRIFPALLLVMIASYAFGWISMLSDEFQQLGKHIAGGAGFVSNLLLWKESGYFDNSTETKPLLHLWSLGIEEQFYIFWPLLLWLAWKLKFNLLTLTLILASISFGLNIDNIHAKPVATFYLPLTRFWELLAGTFLAYINVYKLTSILIIRFDKKNANLLIHLLSYVGFTLILTSMFFITKNTNFPGWWALLPVIGTVLIIAAGPKAQFNYYALSNSALVWIGVISFPLYLWHWPLMSFTRIVEGKELSNINRLTILILSIFLSWLTYELIENKIRKFFNKKLLSSLLIFLMLIVGYIGFNTYKRNGLPFRFKEFTKISAAVGEWQYPGKLQNFEFNGRIFREQKSESKFTTLFIGDSNVEQYYVRADELIRNYPTEAFNIVFSTGGACIPIPNTRFPEYKHCIGLMKSSMELAISRTDIKNVVIGGLWFNFFEGKDKNKNTRPRYFYDNDKQYQIYKDSVGYKKAIEALSMYLSKLKSADKKVFLILNMPVGDELDPKTMVVRSFEQFPAILKIQNSYLNLNKFREKFSFINDDLKHLANLNGAIVVDPIEFLCYENICPSVDANNEPIYKDAAHLRPSFVRKNAEFIDQTLLE